MGIKIIRNNIEVPIQIDTLKIKDVKSAFSNKLSITKSSHPFIILESENTVKALGTANLQSINSVFTDVLFVNDNRIFLAELIIKGFVKGGRKCDVIYTNEVFPHLKRKIASYFSAINIKGDPVADYKEQTSVDFIDEPWQGYVESIIPRTFPEVDFNFPTLKFPTYHGVEIKPDDNWFKYKGEINQKTNGIVSLNSKVVNLINQNVIVPYYYLLAPLYKVFKDTLGYTIKGSFVTNEAIKKTCTYHDKTNLVEITQPNGDTSDWKTVFKHHLTIHPERFLKDKTVAQYINDLKNNYNLDIVINDIAKEITLNFNEQNLFNNKPLDISNYNYNKEVYFTNNTTRAYVLNAADKEDYARIDLTSIENTNVVDDYTVVLSTKFKGVPETLTKEWNDLSGEGLLFYDYKLDPRNHIQEVGSRTNFVWGDKGFINSCWKLWFRMRLRSKNLPLKLICSAKQKTDLQNATNIYVFNQEFLIKSVQFEQIGKDYKVRLDLISLSY